MAVVLTVIGMLVGGLINWLFSRYYYVRAGHELHDEAIRLHAVLNILVYKLENPEAPVTVQRNAEGVITGLMLQLHGQTIASSVATGALTANATPSAGSAPTR